MSRSITATALAVLCAAAVTATPAAAARTEVLYGYAWADGPGALRITPAKATLSRAGVRRHTLRVIPGAKERRIRYTGAEFRRITAACGLKETEGVVRLDSKGLGTTRCTSGDLAFVLGLGPAPVRIALDGRTRIQEFLAAPSGSRTGLGTIRRLNDRAVLFTKGGTTVKLGYTFDLSFSRVTRSCRDGWLANHVNAGQNGLGRKGCGTADFTKALKGVRYPVLAKVDYTPLSGRLNQVWEVFGDA
ncbi:hypothetical protein Misp01_58840 [Microtetraspora sp. NBRC 13810]|uniref:hypothetical protein n=1 Tax=Microtetraspora sp. NBRC 13810 TaxID=3030990 RepID=UPI0024A30311|nr:hypothetical protein [Microtetraspora sp. NBRC 13810]GLW10756.1 hypothetical protein Misp01_58840 [Microtetraspora sp. NBRC 13810]